MTADRQPGRGFTLVEVLVSLGIFALAAVVLGSAYVNVLVGYQTLRAGATEKSDLRFARSLLLAEPQRDVAERGGEMRTTGNGRLAWKARIEEAARADLFNVTVDYEFTPAGAGAVRRQTETFLLLRPSWSDPLKREKLRMEFREELAKRDR